jgi:hypothetical protein
VGIVEQKVSEADLLQVRMQLEEHLPDVCVGLEFTTFDRRLQVITQ